MPSKGSTSTAKTTKTTRRRVSAKNPPDDVLTSTSDADVVATPSPATEASPEAQAEPVPEETPKPRRRRTKKVSVEDKAPAAEESLREDAPAVTEAKLNDAPPPQAESGIDDFGAGLESEAASSPRRNERQSTENAGESSSSAPHGSTGDDTTGRRRRRRRRRRGGSEGDSGGPQQGGQRRQQRGGRGSRDTRDTRDTRGRSQSHGHRPWSSEQNGAEITGTIEGVLELHPKNYGFLRSPERNYAAQDSDAFVSSSVIDKYKLREGVLIRGEVGPGTKGQGPRLKSIETIDGRTVEEYQKIPLFEELTPINPYEQIKLETGPRPITMRVMDLLTPIGKGQRALIVAPPRTGKTMLLHDLAHAVSVNHPEMKLMVLLIDERPEEVTEIRRNVNGEVIASSMDREVESHVRISQLLVERAKRIAEAGGEVFLLLDSITRTARAFNKWIGNSGRTGTGGLDVKAMDIPRKIFGTARRFEEGGSLTILATALIDTGSRMDDAIFQEFKGTGNMELVLSRDLADRRIWPALDIGRSGTRREEKLLDRETLDTVTLLRRSLISLHPTEAMEELVRKLEMFPSNAEFLQKIRNVL